MKKIMVLAICTSLAACSSTGDLTNDNYDKTLGGAGIGAVGGALAGLLLGNGGADTRNKVLIGAGIGALVGGGIGLYMDNQESELRKDLLNSGATITRRGNQIVISLPSNISFQTGNYSLRAEFYQPLNAISKTLKKYNKTLLNVEGHTDSVGSAISNQTLSERRALSVAQYVTGRGVDTLRLRVVGYGESRPIASNSSASGRASNRRVEIAIVPLQ